MIARIHADVLVIIIVFGIIGVLTLALTLSLFVGRESAECRREPKGWRQ